MQSVVLPLVVVHARGRSRGQRGMLEHDGDVVVVLVRGNTLVAEAQHHLDTVDVAGVRGLAKDGGGPGELPPGKVGEQGVVEPRALHHIQDGLEEVGNGACVGRRVGAESSPGGEEEEANVLRR